MPVAEGRLGPGSRISKLATGSRALAIVAALAAGSPARTDTYEINQVSVNALGKAYGYCEGKAMTAARLTQENLDLAIPMLDATLLFGAGIGRICVETEMSRTCSP